MQKILIVEDDATISHLVAKNLRNWGYEVAEVEDFQAVLAFAYYLAQQVQSPLAAMNNFF